MIIGAGAAGLLCAALLVEARREQKWSGTITILEKNNKIGKKLSATGNGRCNFTNLHMTEQCFYGEKNWISSVIQEVTPQDVIGVFRKLGVLHREKDGYVYPHTNQAGTVVRSLEQSCRTGMVDIKLECMVKAVHKSKEKSGYEVVTSQGTIFCQVLVMATGSGANSETGGDSFVYELVRKLGLSVTPVYPGLTGLYCGGNWWKQVAGTRVQGSFSLIIDGKEIIGETGEIQIVKDGVSGIPVFQLCRVAEEAVAHGKKVKGVIDFVPHLTQRELEQWRNQYGLNGVVPEKWISVLEDKKTENIKHFEFDILKSFGMKRAQVAAGGVSLKQVDCHTMEAKNDPNLFLLGELLDVDGMCGGYNLHFAWATAMLSAREIQKR